MVEDTYKYTPSSAHATRQVLESSEPTSSKTSDPKSADFRPQVFRRKSTNYADADAAARATLAESAQSSVPQEDSPADGRVVEENKNETGTGGGSVNWKPKFGRTQSWNQQDLRRSMQMSLVSDGGEKTLPGFTEGKTS
jgi:hypothetical protein